ncbi:MAG: diacylglycerol kinase family lipid kinase [Melioribacteraceae bacterium]|nr:diacylglycerol kinase family lipid kinase [Melioribacteraceae bacterium]
MKALLVFNKFAANRRAGGLGETVRRELHKRGVEFDSIETNGSYNFGGSYPEININEYDALIAAGGDGTIFHTVNLFYDKSGGALPVGVIPIGTGNAFARDLGIKANDIVKSVDAIVKGKTRKADLGKFRENGNALYFSNIIGFGFVTDVAHSAHKMKSIGKLSYTLGVLYHTVFLKPFAAEIEYDGNKIEREILFAEISNTRYTGSDFLMAPSAELDDGFLDITIMNAASRSILLNGLPKIFKGAHVNMKEVETFRARSIKIKTAEPKTLTPDGEILGSTPVQIECLEKAADFFAAD